MALYRRGSILFEAEKVENSNYIRPWPYIHYKAMDGLIPHIRPWPYMRGNTVWTISTV